MEKSAIEFALVLFGFLGLMIYQELRHIRKLIQRQMGIAPK